MNSRRNFLKIGGCSLSTLTLGSAFSRLGMMNAMAQTTGDYKALVCIFMFGGNDSNNMVVPLDARYSLYSQVRGTLAIPTAQLLQIPARTSGTPYGLHPALAPIHPLWAQSRLAVAANVGMLVRPTTRDQYRQGQVPVPTNLFSHSDQTSQWQTAAPMGGTTGWGGRITDRLTQLGTNGTSTFPMGVSVAGGSQLLSGIATKPATVVPGQTTTGLEGSNPANAAMAARDKALQDILSFDAGFALVQSASASLKEGIRIATLISNVTQQNPLATVFPQTGLGNQLAQIARLIQVRTQLGMRRQIFFASIGGFDTHSNQLADHNNLMTQLGQALGAFDTAMNELGVANQVTLFTESEFSRTFQPNQTAGTDHAWGGHHLVMGAAVNGGDVYGRWPEMRLQGPDDSGTRGNWLPSVSLDQYGATLASWFGVSPMDLGTIFPNLANFPVGNLGFLRVS